MMRFFGLCAVLAVGCAAAMIVVGKFAWPDKTGAEPPRNDLRKGGQTSGPTPVDPGESTGSEGGETTPAVRTSREEKVRVTEINAVPRSRQGLILPDGRVLPADRVDVPSDRNGSILFLATPAMPGEYVPADKLIVRTMTLLGIEVKPGEQVPPGQLIENHGVEGKYFRLPNDKDVFEPGKTAALTVQIRFRRISEDDPVEEGQILGIIRPDMAVDDLKIKQSKLDASQADYIAARATTVELRRLYDVNVRLKANRSLNQDELAKSEVQYERAKSEEVSKKSGVEVSQRELSAAWTILRLHTLRAPISGTIRTLYKQQGEAVKDLDSVLLLQNTARLRVEAQVEVQDALPLRERLDQARQLRMKANQISRAQFNPKATQEAATLRAKADALVQVEIEASRPQAPVAVLQGHLREVNCVAVSRGPNAKIISGSEEGIVRVWERVTGEDRWEERFRITLGDPVRSLACTSDKAGKNLLATATSAGRIRLFEIDSLKEDVEGVPLEYQHQGAVTALSFSVKGDMLASGGEDRSICVWNTANQKRLLRRNSAHQNTITSLAFTPKELLVSAGRDKRLSFWKMDQNNSDETVLSEAERPLVRSGDVPILGLDPTGEYTLFDEGRELKVVSLARRRIAGSLVNSGASGSFSTLALFSPDGKTVLTNSTAAGRLQLWRAPSDTTRAAELRQFLWSSGQTLCGTFDPKGEYLVTGTTDHQVLVWKMPSVAEATRPVKGELTYVEGFLDTSLKRVTVRASLDNRNGWVIPGAAASIIVPPAPIK